MDEPIKENEWINARSINQRIIRPVLSPKVDKEVSQIVGKEVRINDPRLIKVVTEFKRHKNPDEEDNFLKRSAFINQLKEAFK